MEIYHNREVMHNGQRCRVVINDRRVANAQTAGNGEPDRKAIIEKAAKEWTASAEIRKITTEKAWISEALREAGLPGLEPSDMEEKEETDPERMVVINRAASEFAANSELARFTNRASFVNTALHDAGKAGLSERERHSFS